MLGELIYMVGVTFVVLVLLTLGLTIGAVVLAVGIRVRDFWRESGWWPCNGRRWL